MNEQALREALRSVADDGDGAAGAWVVPVVLRRARRRRLARLVAAPVAAVLAVLVGAGATLLPPRLADPAGPPPADVAGLPERLDKPGLRTPTIRGAPPGPVAVAFSGSTFAYVSLLDSARVAVAGPGGYAVTHRWSQDELHPGEGILLSPAGDRLAWNELDGPIRIQDLRTGAVRALHPPAGTGYSLCAWSPDGGSLAIVEFHGRPGPSELGLFDVATGAYRRVATAGDGLFPGSAVAFSPDGKRLAYQAGDRLTVVSLDGTVLSTVTLARHALLTGKGAFTPDGSGLVIATADSCCELTRMRWRLSVLDAATGAPQAAPEYPVIDDAVAVRVQGWLPGGTPVATVYRPERRELPRGYVRQWGYLTGFAYVRRVDVVVVPADTEALRRLVVTSDQTLAADVAADAIATGRVLPAPPVPSGVPPGWVVWSLVVAGILLAVSAGGVPGRRRGTL